MKRRWQWRPERKQDQTAGDEDQNQNHTMIHLVQNDSNYFQNDTILHCGNTTRHPGDKNVLHVFCVRLRPEHRSWQKLQVKEQSCSDLFVEQWFKLSRLLWERSLLGVRAILWKGNGGLCSGSVDYMLMFSTSLIIVWPDICWSRSRYQIVFNSVTLVL